MKSLNYKKFGNYVENLRKDVYPQPSDKGHFTWAEEAIAKFYQSEKYNTVLDIGCGDGFSKDIFMNRACLHWRGVSFDKSLEQHIKHSSDIDEADMVDLPYGNGSYDFLFVRHVLEHSPMPVIALMEFRRIVSASGVLLLIAPGPAFWGVRGRNHYSVLYREQLSWLLNRAGWDIVSFSEMTNHDDEFLSTWRPWFVAVDRGKTHTELLGILPDGPQAVEYRFFCKPGQEITGG